MRSYKNWSKKSKDIFRSYIHALIPKTEPILVLIVDDTHSMLLDYFDAFFTELFCEANNLV